VTLAAGKAIKCDESAALGIIDPFMPHYVMPGQRVYMLLKPYTITTLRHEWTHPLIEQPETAQVSDERAASEQYLRAFAEDNGIGYRKMMDAVADAITNAVDGDKWGFTGITLDHDIDRYPDEEFWTHYGVVVGRAIAPGQRASWLGCSC
jgi:hypothetical protein